MSLQTSEKGCFGEGVRRDFFSSTIVTSPGLVQWNQQGARGELRFRVGFRALVGQLLVGGWVEEVSVFIIPLCEHKVLNYGTMV